MEILEKLKEQGWFLTADGLKRLPEKSSDPKKIIQSALDFDLRDIAGGALPAEISKKEDTITGKIVLQVIKIRNISAPKANEEHKGSPRFLQLDLTDGIVQVQALEMEQIKELTFNTPPGTKIYFKPEKIQITQGLILMKANDINILGGKVPALIEKWEMNRTLLKYARGGRMMTGSSGPPPWTPFGQKIQQNNITANDKNFKSLAVAGEKDKEGKENNEFDSMRNEAIAEAAKTGTKKVFGGGNQQIVDFNVKKVMEKGYSEEEAKNALKATRNNLERALYNLKRRDEFKNNRNDDYRSKSQIPQTSSGPSRDNFGRSGRGGTMASSNRKGGKDDLAVPTKPAANVSLFDFLTDKLPANTTETATSTTSSHSVKASSVPPQSSNQSRYDRGDSRPERSQRSNIDSKQSYSSSHHQSNNYSDSRHSHKNSSQQLSSNIPPTRNSMTNSNNLKFENTMSSSFHANRNHQDDRPTRNYDDRSNRNYDDRSIKQRQQILPNKSQSNTLGRQSSYYDDSDRYNRNDNRNDTRNDNRYDQYKNDRSNYNSRPPLRSDRNNYHSSNNYQQQQHSGNYENTRRNEVHKNGFENRAQPPQQNNLRNQQPHQTSMPRYQTNKDNNYQSNSSRSYNNDNRNSNNSYHHQQNDKMNKLVEETSKLKLDQKSTGNVQVNRPITHSATANQPPRTQQQPIPQNPQPQIVAMIPHHSTVPTTMVHSQHMPPTHHPQQQQQKQPQSQQVPQSQPTPTTIQHLQPQTQFTALPNGFAYDPSKIIGFQTKEANEYAMTLLKSQGIPPTMPGISGTAMPPSTNTTTTSVVAHAQYPPPLQIGHPPQAFAAAPFVMQQASVVPPPVVATQVHPGSVVGAAQPYSINSGATWNWKAGDRCFAKYWDDGRFYEAEITGISDKTCVVFFLGYGNHEEVLKSDCVPLTDSQNRIINFGGSVVVSQPQQIAAVLSQQQQQQQQQQRTRFRTEKRQMYIPPPKREV